MKRLLELDAYLTGELVDGPALDALEEAMFDAPDDPDLAFVDVLAQRGAVLASHGTFNVSITRAELDARRASGEAFEIVDCGAPGPSQPVVTGGGDLVCTMLRIGPQDAQVFDVEIYLVAQGVTKVIRDVSVDPTDGVIYALCERPLAEIAFGAGRTIARVRRRDGARDVIAEWDVQQP